MKKVINKKIVSIILVLSMIITMLPLTNNLSLVSAADQTYKRLNVLVNENDDIGAFKLAQAQFAAKGYDVELVTSTTSETTNNGDIVVNAKGEIADYGNEGYKITVNSDDTITLTAATPNGTRYGLNDILQQLENNGEVSSCEMTQPFSQTRALFVDCGRKYFSVEWFEEIIREMSWNGMNTLYMSFSNDEGFRFLLDDMSLSFDDGSGNTVSYSDEFMTHLCDNPERVSDSAFLTERNAEASDEGNTRVVTNYDNNKYLTQKDMNTIIEYAKAYGINIIPELNTPGHFGAVMWYFPEYRIQGTWYSDGQPHYGLDLTNTEAYNFGQALVKKYIDYFASRGITSFCVGGDEYSQGSATNQQVASYTNALVSYLEDKNMKAYAWNDGQAAANNLLNNNAVVNAWNGSNPNYNSVNFNSNYLYYVLKGYEWKPNPQTLFETWTPLTYNGTAPSSNKAEGAALAIWCDVPNKETPEYVLESIVPSLRSFGYKTWNFSETSTTSLTNEYSSYSEFAADATSAPKVSEIDVLESVGAEVDYTSVVLPEPSYGNYYELVTFASENPIVSTNSGWYYDGANAVDGDTSTVAWTNSEQTVGQYIQVDLGIEKYIENVSVTSPSGTGDICENANVLVSTNGSTWNNVGTHDGSDGTTSHVVNSNIRYIRIEITTAKNNWWKIAEINWTPRSTTSSATLENGTYIIVNGTNKAMTSTASGSGFANSSVTIDGTHATPLNDVYEWTFTKQSNGSYYVTNANGRYLNINSSGLTVSTTSQEISLKYVGNKVVIYNEDNGINYYSGNGQIFSRWNTSTSDANNLQTLYKKIEGGLLSTGELYNLIMDAREFNNDNGRYDSDAYSALQTQLINSTKLYLEASNDSSSVTQDEIDASADALRKAIETLELSDTTLDYIDIPMEILDFRADGVMFEYAQNTSGKGLYELLTDTKFGGLTYANESVPMPGTVGDRLTNDEWNGWNDTCKRTGLTEDYLVDNAPVYKEATVDYVAKLIGKGYFADLSSVENWNSTMSEKIESLSDGYNSTTDTNRNLGTWEDTLAKTSTKANGGKLEWADVETCYDLAYYVLNNMWRSTQEADGVDTYNKTVGENMILRMLKGDDGYYYLDSTKEITYTDSYIFNTDLTTANTDETKFTPINDRGYEDSESYGDTTDTTTGTNFHFTLHAFGSFVYNADENLYFYFDGDDDVYFYINGKLAMDLGGAHSHCDDEIYLNEIADEFGLVDGGIYSFDMFYAERHTTQANLEFKTNIKIMDTMSTTSKGQYYEETGVSIPYGSIVDEDTTVAYSFNLLNLRSVNIYDISFIDESLGSYISKDSIKLYDPNLTNGATTSITDISLYYNTYDRPAPNEVGVINSETPVTVTVTEMVDLIETANNNLSSLDKGTYVVSISNEDELKLLMKTGLPIDTQVCVYGVKRTVIDTDRPYVNTVTSRAYYTSNNKKVTLNGIATQKLTVLNSFSAPADKEQVVIDYGKPLNINLSNVNSNLHLNDGVKATLYGITVNGAHNQTRTSTSGITCNTVDTVYAPISSKGTYRLLGTNNNFTDIEFTLSEFLSKVEKVYAVYKIEDSSLDGTEYETYYLLVEIDIIPATSMYYETDFAEGIFTTNKDITASNAEEWSTSTMSGYTSDGPQDDGTIGLNQTYGYDSSYENDRYLSDASSLFVNGLGRTKTMAYFSFTGTGFDLISRTGALQGAIRVDVYSDAAMTKREKAVTVINKSESDLELYQIPVVSIDTLDYGTYYVKVGVNAEYDSDGNGTIDTNVALDRGNEFYFDAVRIYNPYNMTDVNEDLELVKSAYKADGEYNQAISEIRALLLDSTNYNTTADNRGVLFVDRTQTTDIATYSQIGPNNEVYLTKGQAIAFELYADAGTLTSFDIGAKSVNGTKPTLSVTISKDANGTDSYTFTKEIDSATSLFYDIMSGTNNNISNYVNENGNIFVVITNTASDTILSLTDVKVAYNNEPAITPYFMARTLTRSYADSVLDELEVNYDILDVQSSSSTYGFLRKVTLKVLTNDDVETLKVVDKNNIKQYIKTSYVINEDGNKEWTVTFTPLYIGNQTYTVTGAGSDGTTGESLSTNVRISLFAGLWG